jgi:hypothetical protein
LKVGAKIEDPKIDKPDVKGDIRIRVLDLNRPKLDIPPSILK